MDIIIGEHDGVQERERPQCALGSIYAVPEFDSVNDSLGWRLGSSIARRLDPDGVQPHSLQLQLTPALEPLSPSLLGPSTLGAAPEHTVVAVGLDPEQWRTADWRQQRQWLAEAVEVALRQAFPTLVGTDQVLRAIGKEHAALDGLAQRSDGRLSIPATLWASLRLDAFDALTPTVQQAAAAALAAALAGQRELQFVGIKRHGPTGDERAVPMFRDLRTGWRMALVCGGEWAPGYARAALDHLVQVAERLDPIDPELSALFGTEVRDARIAAWRAAASAGWLRVFGSAAPCPIAQRRPVSIDPMLVGVNPLRIGTPGLTEVLGARWTDSKREIFDLDSKLRSTPAPHAFEDLVASFDWRALPDVCAHYACDLIRSDELEWCVAGARHALFPWGDGPTRSMLEWCRAPVAPGLPPDPPAMWLPTVVEDPVAEDPAFNERAAEKAPWPLFNRFGLAAPLNRTVWCQPSADPTTPACLISRGGAGGALPWQACDEWSLSLTAAETRAFPDTDHAASILPMFRLGRS